MSEIAVENINVAEILGSAQGAEGLEKVEAAIASDPEVGALVKAAQSVEDVYEIVKKFSTATFEQVKVLFKKTVDYFKESKAVLSDEVLDNVAGGMSFGDFWNTYKSGVIGGIVMISCVAIGAIAGACVAGVGGAIAGAAIGAIVGGVGMAAFGVITGD